MVFMFSKKSVGKDSKGMVGEGEFYILISHLSIFPYNLYMLCARQRMGYREQCPRGGQGGAEVCPRVEENFITDIVQPCQRVLITKNRSIELVLLLFKLS